MMNINRSTDKQHLSSFLFQQRTESEQTSFGTHAFESGRFIPTFARDGLEETNGRISFDPFLVILDNSKLLGELWQIIDRVDNVETRNKVCELVYSFQEIILLTKRLGIDISYLPKVKAFLNTDDESLLVEWIFSDFRIGFTLETNDLESGWYLVSNSNLGSINVSGDINKVALGGLVLWLFLFALDHA
ncbi:MAG: hypothetical protein HQ521_20525 [Bacteroidetes bacterium]|nr:hypothetical protein [Bacteroidota bacterium]